MLIENFDAASTKRVNSRAEEKVDPTVYLGTGGVTYGLLRASCLPSQAGASTGDTQDDEETKLDAVE